MIDFLKDNWRLILEGTLVVISFVFCVFRKKPVKIVDFVKEFILEVLPKLIRVAEEEFEVGSDKKKFVLDTLARYAKENGFELTDSLRKFASDQIEAILSTPKKKGSVIL